MYGIDEDLLKGFDNWSAHHRKLYQRSLIAAAENDASQIALDSEPNREFVSSSLKIPETSKYLRGKLICYIGLKNELGYNSILVLDSGKLQRQLLLHQAPPTGPAGPAATVFTESTKTGPAPSKGYWKDCPMMTLSYCNYMLQWVLIGF